MDNFFKANIYSYLLFGPVEKNYQEMKDLLADLKVKPFHIYDLALTGGDSGIEEIRQVQRQVRIKPAEPEVRFYLLLKARSLGRPAQNSLLKLLEEPPRYLRIIIFAQGRQDILPTLISRCLTIRSVVSQPVVHLSYQLERILAQPLSQRFELAKELTQKENKENLAKIIDSWLLTTCPRGVSDKDTRELCQSLLNVKRLIETTNINQRLLLDNLFLKNDI